MYPSFSLMSVLVCVLVFPVAVAGYDVSLTGAALSVSENSGVITVSVFRASSGVGECSVGFKTISETALPGRDYASTEGKVVFASDQTLVPLEISLVSDTVPESSKTFIVVLESFSNCVPGEVTNSAIIVRDAQTTESMSQGFESGLPSGWGITTNSYSNGFWRLNDPGGWGNETGGRGCFAIADSDYCGKHDMDTELRMAPFSVAVTALTYLVFRTYYEFGGSDIADVDVSCSGGEGPWVNLWRKQHEGQYGILNTINLTPEVRGQSNVMVRFHYYNANWDWYWQIDDVAILVEPDTNTNGLPDWWETAYYSCVTNLDPRADSDGDGACNEDEFIAGTHPGDTGSCFMVKGVIYADQSVAVAFPTEIGHFYDLLSCTNLVDEPWSNQVFRIPGTGSPTNISLSAQGSGGFYRVNVHRW